MVLIWLFVYTVSAFKKFYSLTFFYRVLFLQKLLYVIRAIEFIYFRMMNSSNCQEIRMIEKKLCFSSYLSQSPRRGPYSFYS